mmetsp:Transcript_23725/g.38237  ORF Transcript_23725/g.38237 Transcript_23725/m.38237 type:complete len:170 (+) Transcript_23725:114-623(+)
MATKSSKRARTSSQGSASRVDEVKNVIVFQCHKCRRILTDSNYLVEMDEDSKTITFKAARGVRVTDKILVSRSSKEYGSTYKKLVCEACDCDLGKQYLTTPQQLDSARSRYCFNVSALESYEVGRLEEMAENSPLESFGILQRLRVRHTQMMQILIQFDKRIKLLEERR